MADTIGNILSENPSDIQTPEQYNESTYGSIPQQALTAVEGAAKGAVGPLAPALEQLSGLTTGSDITARQETNPITHIAGEAAGFIGSQFVPGLDEVSLGKQVGQLGQTAAKLAPLAPKLIQTGVKAGAELSALAASDELSKLVQGNPDQTIGTAAINIGLSGLLGGAGGVVLGGTSQLLKTTANKLGLTKLASDFMGELKLLQEGANAGSELAGRQAEIDALRNAVPEVADKLPFMPTEGPFPNFPSKSQLSSAIGDNKGLTEGPFKNFPPAPGTQLLKSYIKSSQDVADKVATKALDAGLPVPPEAILNPTPALDGQLGKKPTPGQLLATWAYTKGSNTLSGGVGRGVAYSLGSLGGALLGHPIIGGIAAERVLGPIFSTLARPFAERAVDGLAMRSAVDGLSVVLRGQSALTNAVKGAFTKGAQIVSKDLLPSQESRDRLEKSLEAFQNPQHAFNVGGNIGHYLPTLGSAVAQSAAVSSNYLQQLKPKQAPANPLDSVPPIDSQARAKYNRALDIAQQPLLALKWAKEGTLLPADVQALHTMYPGLHQSMVSQLSQKLIESQVKGEKLPYSQRVSMGLLMGSHLDSTMTPQAAQAVLLSSKPIQPTTQEHRGNQGPTGEQLKAINKAGDIYATRNEQRQLSRGRR